MKTSSRSHEPMHCQCEQVQNPLTILKGATIVILGASLCNIDIGTILVSSKSFPSSQRFKALKRDCHIFSRCASSQQFSVGREKST